jgi:hypothetical protein
VFDEGVSIPRRRAFADGGFEEAGLVIDDGAPNCSRFIIRNSRGGNPLSRLRGRVGVRAWELRRPSSVGFADTFSRKREKGRLARCSLLER